VVGRALLDGYRDRVNLATKLPGWLVESRDDMDRYLAEQLEKLRTDRIDFYLLHGLIGPFWERLTSLGVLEFLDDAIADGRIRYAGFSFHDTEKLFKNIVKAYDWTFAQIQYNFMDEEYQAGTKGLLYAARKGLGIVVMEPIRGGLLARKVPGITEIWQESPTRRTPAEWALRWVWDHPGVTVVLSGMSTFDQVVQNISYAGGGLPGSLTKKELAMYDRVREEFRKRMAIPCTGCKYCMPCPHGVSIPECFELFNQAHMYDAKESVKETYTQFLRGFLDGVPAYASCCQDCGECEEKCPQGLPIRENLRKVSELFGR
jgi:predicted aldo/keto reductase-like oxidoreductase